MLEENLLNCLEENSNEEESFITQRNTGSEFEMQKSE